MTRVFDTQGNSIVVVAAATLRTAGRPILPCNVDWRGHECAARLRVCGEPQWYDVQMPFCVCSFPWHSIGEKAVVLQNVVFLFAHVGANGRTGQQWKRMLPDLNARLGKDCHVRSAAYDSVHWWIPVIFYIPVIIFYCNTYSLRCSLKPCNHNALKVAESSFVRRYCTVKV
jgi:hypothetical protein